MGLGCFWGDVSAGEVPGGFPEQVIFDSTPGFMQETSPPRRRSGGVAFGADRRARAKALDLNDLG